ncbi:TetR/AcrR family transcriptional regulator [Nocardioidaceae bacterium SCSIO 66511]|nr:TetR/AcrR family transcriptional regulator [Nocardioidaceae bacterium SCSIO 66511]
MPKVSEEHRTARREQILDAAMIRFADNGFQATGMADVIAATGLSAGAVYRYFKSKDQLIEAIVDRVLSRTADRFGELLTAGSVPEPGAAVRIGVEAIDEMASKAPVEIGRLAVQAWGEALRNDRVSAVVSNAYSVIKGYYAEVSRRAVEAGAMPPGADPDALAAAMYSLTAGYVLQRTLELDVDAQAYGRAVEALLAGNRPH